MPASKTFSGKIYFYDFFVLLRIFYRCSQPVRTAALLDTAAKKTNN
jgi:hypothetical protein